MVDQPHVQATAVPIPDDEPEVIAMSASHLVIRAPRGHWVTIMCPVGFSPSSIEGLDLSKPLFARVRYLAG